MATIVAKIRLRRTQRPASARAPSRSAEVACTGSEDCWWRASLDSDIVPPVIPVALAWIRLSRGEVHADWPRTLSREAFTPTAQMFRRDGDGPWRVRALR